MYTLKLITVYPKEHVVVDCIYDVMKIAVLWTLESRTQQSTTYNILHGNEGHLLLLLTHLATIPECLWPPLVRVEQVNNSDVDRTPGR